MFRITINNIDYVNFSKYQINLKYDAIASSFGFSAQRDILEYFLDYPECKIYKHNELILTGTILSPNITKSTIPNFIRVNGYGKAGVLEDCTVPLSLYPLQFDNLSLVEIAEKLLLPFDIKYTFTSNIIDDFNKKYEKITLSPTTTVKQILTSLAAQRNIYITSNNKGEVVFTRYDKSKFLPVYQFIEGGSGLRELNLTIKSQGLHSEITVVKEASDKNPDSGEHTIYNPYVSVFRPIVKIMSNGDIFDIEKAARNALAEELKNITITIKSTVLIKAGNTITLKAPSIKLNKHTELFVVETIINGSNNNDQDYTLKCVIPETFSDGEVKNIFT